LPAVATVTNAAGQSIVYTIGGLTPTRMPSAKVTAYNVASNTWTFRRPLPKALAGSSGAGVIDGKIYVSGGYSDWGGDFPGTSLYMYDPATNTWTQKSGIPRVDGAGGDHYYGMGNGVTGVISGKLYVVSGCFMAWEPWGYYEDCSPLFFRYNPVTDRWVTLPRPFAEPTYAPSVGGVIGGKFYVMGQSPYTHDARFAVYDPATNQWTAKTPLGLSRPGAASAVLDGKLYVMGGSRYNAKTDAWEMLDITIVYDPATDVSLTLHSMTTDGDGRYRDHVCVYCSNGHRGGRCIPRRSGETASPTSELTWRGVSLCGLTPSHTSAT
jgi:N-acetylneuraminic acid mutarotase